ncbi:MAG: hypothetical protein AB1898_17680 [Acidobacteriota bacterium]
MPFNTVSNAIRFLTVVLASTLLVGCGKKLSGTYSGKDTGFLDKMTFKSGGKVDLTFMGMTREGTYEIDGNQVKITNAGDTQVLAIDSQGCLDGGGFLGRYCQEGHDAAGSSRTAGQTLGIYEAGEGPNRLTLEFRSGNRLRLTFVEAGAETQTLDADYRALGNRITVQAPDGQRMELTLNGNVLEGSVPGAGNVRFVKR